MRVMIPLLLALSLATADAQAPEPAPCPRISAPAKFKMGNASIDAGISRSNTGIVPSGFVDLPDQPVVHGIDVSKYQDAADFKSVYDCGARFAYVRLTGGTNPDHELLYRTHWANARAAGLIPGPYHNLTILPDDIKRLRSGTLASLREQVPKLLSAATAHGEKQAEIFLARLQEVLSLDPGGAEGKLPWLPVALDLSSRPMAGMPPDYAKEFGGVYGATICGFINKIRQSSFGKRPIMLFLSPSEFSEYGLDGKLRCGSAQNDDIIIWLRFRSQNGLGYRDSLEPSLTNRFCGEGKTQNICRFEQYTSFGGFAVFQKGAPLDLDRFYGTEQQLLDLAGERP